MKTSRSDALIGLLLRAEMMLSPRRFSQGCGSRKYGIENTMNENITVVFNGFLNLPNLDKLALVNAINEYFDSNEREPIRAEADERFGMIDMESPDFRCKCCGR